MTDTSSSRSPKGTDTARRCRQCLALIAATAEIRSSSQVAAALRWINKQDCPLPICLSNVIGRIIGWWPTSSVRPMIARRSVARSAVAVIAIPVPWRLAVVGRPTDAVRACPAPGWLNTALNRRVPAMPGFYILCLRAFSRRRAFDITPDLRPAAAATPTLTAERDRQLQ